VGELAFFHMGEQGLREGTAKRDQRWFHGCVF
jgi:hypothetical protein